MVGTPQKRPSQGFAAPIFGPLIRNCGFLLMSMVWISFQSILSSSLFGKKELLDQLITGNGITNDDFGLSGDFLLWGELVDDSQLDSNELLDLAYNLIDVYSSAISSMNETFSNSWLNSNDSSFLFEDSGIDTLFGADFAPELFLKLNRDWLLVSEDKNHSTHKLIPAPGEKLLQKARQLEKNGRPQRVPLDRILAGSAGGQAGNAEKGGRNVVVKAAEAVGHFVGNTYAKTPRFLRPWTWGRNSQNRIKDDGETSDELATDSKSSEESASPAPTMSGLSDERRAVLEALRDQLVGPAATFPKLAEEAAATGFSLDDASLARYLDVTRWQLQDTSRRDGNSVAQMIHDTVTWRVESGLFGVNGLLAGPLPPQLYEGVPFFSSSSPGCASSDATAADDAGSTGLSSQCNASSTSSPKEGFHIPYYFSPEIAARLTDAAHRSRIYVNGFDRDGRAVVIYSPTKEGECSVELSMLSLAYNLERALALSTARGQPASTAQYTFIVDLANMAGFAPPLKTVKASFGVMGRHFPMRSGRILLVHGGSMIQWVWRILEPIVDPRTRAKVAIVAEKDEAELMASLFSPDQLERRFAGGENDLVFDPDNYLGLNSSHIPQRGDAAERVEAASQDTN